METKNIQEFLALAELGSSYAAAEKLFVSQSSLVRHIQVMEEEFGVSLFDRTRRGFSLNANGRIFLPYAKKIALAQAQCYKALHHKEEEKDVIRISAECKIMDLMIDFKKEFPQYSIEYHKHGDLDELLHTGIVDVAFLTNMLSIPEGLTMIPYCTEEVLVLLYDTHPLAGRESISIEELRGEKLIGLCDEMVLFNEAFINMFSRIGFVPDFSVTVPTGSDVLQMVSEKIGITLIHGKAETTPEYPGVKTIPLNPRMEYKISMCYRNDVPLGQAAQEFVTFTKKWGIMHKDVNMTMIQ